MCINSNSLKQTLKSVCFHSSSAHFISWDRQSSIETFYTSLIEHCTTRNYIARTHNRIYIHGVQNNGFIITKLINACSDIGEIEYARHLFDAFPDKYVFLWNGIIRGYSMHGMLAQVLQMYSNMQLAYVSPDSFTFPNVFKACGGLMAVDYGRVVHGQVFRHGYGEDLFVQNGVLIFYSKCGRNDSACAVFNTMSTRNIVSWTSMISGYAQNLQPLVAMSVFRDMIRSGVKPDWISLISVLKACSDVEELILGKSVHALAINMGFEFEQDMRVSLTSFYAKCGLVVDAKYLFDLIEVEDTLLWNAMIAGFVKNGHTVEALNLFNEMISKGIHPDAGTLQSAIMAFSQHGSLKQAQWMGSYVEKSRFRDDTYIRSALIDMYSKCGNVELAREVFDSTTVKDVVLWSAMIMGYAVHGQGREAINLCNDMKDSKILPNEVTFLGLITACSHSGLVEEGWNFFLGMNDHSVAPQQKHYAGVVDMLGRVGHLAKAFNVIRSMPVEPSVSVWGALLGACKIHRNLRLGEFAARKVFALDPLHTGHYVQLSNLYALTGMWDQVDEVRVLMKSKGLSKGVGISTIEINGKLQSFRMGDRSHARSDEIYRKLQWLEMKLMEFGFKPDIESALHDLDEEDRGFTFCNHSERLAIAYGLICTSPGTTLRIIKNLRACVNCHCATKLISKIVDREIVVRDANRFHHFKDGACSCADFW